MLGSKIFSQISTMISFTIWFFSRGIRTEQKNLSQFVAVITKRVSHKRMYFFFRNRVSIKNSDSRQKFELYM